MPSLNVSMEIQFTGLSLLKTLNLAFILNLFLTTISVWKDYLVYETAMLKTRGSY